MWKKAIPKKPITVENLKTVDAGVTAFLAGLDELKNIDDDEKKAFVSRGHAIVREWVSKGLEQWSANS